MKIWVGDNAPFSDFLCENKVIEKLGQYRCDPTLHGKATELYFHEFPISDFPEWPIILDETLRLGSSMCTFSFLLKPEPYFFLPVFLKYLQTMSRGTIRHVATHRYYNGCWLFKFTAQRALTSHKPDWTFGVLWDGTNTQNLTAFIESVEAQCRGGGLEILVCGPEIDVKTSISLKFLSAGSNSEKFANISRKKNAIVQAATYENICITHNRYILGGDFISSFEKFGYDFSIVSVPQRLADGTRVPDWVTRGSSFYPTRNYLLEYGAFSPYQYSPGGLVIGKRSVFERVPWNDLGVWDSGEDVELSERLRDNGVLPRLNLHTSVEVTSLRAGIIEDFPFLPASSLYHIPKRNIKSILDVARFVCHHPKLAYQKFISKVMVSR